MHTNALKVYYPNEIPTFFWDMCSKYDVKSDLSSESMSESILDTMWINRLFESVAIVVLVTLLICLLNYSTFDFTNVNVATCRIKNQ